MASIVLLIFLLIFIILPSPLLGQQNCSRMCVAKNCSDFGIRYGKFCGVGWTGCAGEEPCDDLDHCCRKHDECVEKKGIASTVCHTDFKRCMEKVVKSKKQGFSKKCPYELVIPVMRQGMDMAILFSALDSKATS